MNEKTQRALRILIWLGIVYLGINIFLMLLTFISPFLPTF